MVSTHSMCERKLARNSTFSSWSSITMKMTFFLKHWIVVRSLYHLLGSAIVCTCIFTWLLFNRIVKDISLPFAPGINQHDHLENVQYFTSKALNIKSHKDHLWLLILERKGWLTGFFQASLQSSQTHAYLIYILSPVRGSFIFVLCNLVYNGVM